MNVNLLACLSVVLPIPCKPLAVKGCCKLSLALNLSIAGQWFSKWVLVTSSDHRGGSSQEETQQIPVHAMGEEDDQNIFLSSVDLDLSCLLMSLVR